MAPSHPAGDRTEVVEIAVRRLAVESGSSIHAARIGRRWSLRRLAAAAAMSPSAVQRIEAGGSGSLEAYASLGAALGLRADLVFVDGKSQQSGHAQADAVHAAMGEIEVARLSAFGFATGVDEPYQHFQFAGRADVLAWSIASRALLHIENRTRFPNVQEAAGAWNAKRQYLPGRLAERLGTRWKSITHAMVGLWTRELLEEVRRHRATFQSICPDDGTAFDAWWHGKPPAQGVSATFVLLDPVASTRRQVGQLDGALADRARHRGYAEVAMKLRRR